ncbi:MAG: NrtA/SsuA/CpmA family ABC transporter substrate-binding protein [Halofilum sp. (in: g-proteobacteria)]
MTAPPIRTRAIRPRRPRRTAFAACVLCLVATAANAETIRIAGVDYLGDLPTRVADHEGLFAAAGVDAVVQYAASGRDALRALRAGETDFALMALTPLAIDLVADSDPRGPDDPVILASLVHSTRMKQVVALDRGARTPRDLAGSRIGLARGTSAEFAWSLFTAYHGIAPGDAEVIDTPIERLPGALKSGDIDAAMLWEPWTTRLRTELGDRLRVLPGSNIYTAKWVLVTRRELVDADPERAQTVLSAYQAAIDIIQRDVVAVDAVYAADRGGEADALQQNRSSILYGLNLDWSLLASLQQQTEWAINAGYAIETPSTDILARIDPRPLAACMPSAVGLPYTREDEGPQGRSP